MGLQRQSRRTPFAILVAALSSCLPESPCMASAGESDSVVHPYSATSDRYCGTESLFVCLIATGRDATLADLEATAEVGPRGMSARQLIDLSSERGVRLDAVSTNLQVLRAWNRPAVLHVNEGHWLGFLSNADDRLLVFDNRSGLLALTEAEFTARYRWSGTALVVGGAPSRLASALDSWWLLAAVLGCVAAREVVLAGGRWKVRRPTRR